MHKPAGSFKLVTFKGETFYYQTALAGPGVPADAATLLKPEHIHESGKMDFEVSLAAMLDMPHPGKLFAANGEVRDLPWGSNGEGIKRTTLLGTVEEIEGLDGEWQPGQEKEREEATAAA